MYGKRKVNQSHPDYKKYMAAFDKIWDDYSKLEKLEKTKFPEWSGLDHPADAVLRPAYKKCCEATKELQKKYSYLFIEDGFNG